MHTESHLDEIVTRIAERDFVYVVENRCGVQARNRITGRITRSRALIELKCSVGNLQVREEGRKDVPSDVLISVQ